MRITKEGFKKLRRYQGIVSGVSEPLFDSIVADFNLQTYEDPSKPKVETMLQRPENMIKMYFNGSTPFEVCKEFSLKSKFEAIDIINSNIKRVQKGMLICKDPDLQAQIMSYQLVDAKTQNQDRMI